MTAYVGEIRMFAGNFPPAGWEFCQGQELPISENEVLFQLIGTTYGGDGESSFRLPDLQSRTPIHFGQLPGGANYPLSEAAGVEQVTLTQQQMPNHQHAFSASTALGGTANPSRGVIAQPTDSRLYLREAPNTPLAPESVTAAGGSQPHDNMGPTLAINFIISLFGVFPSPT